MDKMNFDIFEVIDETSNVGYLFIYNLTTGMTRWSKAAVEYFHLQDTYSKDLKSLFASLVHPQDLEKFNRDYALFSEDAKPHLHSNCYLRNNEGIYVKCEIYGRNNRDNTLFIGNIVVDEAVIGYDSVTQLPTFYEFLNVLKKSKYSNNKFATMYIDVSHFHAVNSVYGYDFGNKFLYALASELKNLLKGKGKIYRLEGAKFAFYLNDRNAEVIQQLFWEIKELVNHFNFEGNVISLDIHGGAVVIDSCEVDVHAYVSYLISSLEQAKDNRTNDLVIFNDEVEEKTLRSLAMLETIKHCIFDDCKGFYLCYQPLVSTVNGVVIGAEALIRWRNEEYGEVSPYQFISHLENHPSFYKLGLWIIKQALQDAKKIMKINPDFFVNVNVSYTQLEHENFKNDVLTLLEELQFPPNHLQIELTERIRNLDLGFLKKELNFFREHNIKIALDDFGTGNATLGLVCELPIDTLKIDQMFVLDILKDKSSQIIVDTILECASRLGIDVCIEGVENQEICDFLQQYPANYHQGYYYSRPVEFDVFEKLVDKCWASKQPLLIKETVFDGLNVQSILSKMPGGFFIYTANEEETIIEINETVMKMYGCNSVAEFAELTNNSFKGMVHPEDYSRISREINRQVASSEAEMDYVEYRIVRKDGSTQMVRDYGRLVHVKHNDDLFFVFIMPMNQGIEKMKW